MNRFRIALAAVSAALVTGVGAAAASAHATKLTAVVADPLKIAMTRNGKEFKSLRAGTYTIVVKDSASDHNFHLTGPGLDKRTSVSGTGTFTWTVKLKKGTYRFVCDPHKGFMKGSFTVT